MLLDANVGSGTIPTCTYPPPPPGQLAGEGEGPPSAPTKKCTQLDWHSAEVKGKLLLARSMETRAGILGRQTTQYYIKNSDALGKIKRIKSI
jgi:hypothetical protein